MKAHREFDPLSVKSKQEQPDLLHYILTSDLPDQEKLPTRIANEVLALIGAGSITVAKVMTNGFYHILADEKVLQRLTKKLDEAICNPAVIPPVKDLERLPFLVSQPIHGYHIPFSRVQTAVIRESLRISAVISSRMPMTSPEKPLQYHGWCIPPGVGLYLPFFPHSGLCYFTGNDEHDVVEVRNGSFDICRP